MEHVWEYLRAKNKLSYCVWDSHDEILAACADAWNWLVNPAKIPAGTKTPGSEESPFYTPWTSTGCQIRSLIE
jgi:hypothetical protein